MITAGDVNVDRLETSISFLESKWPAYENAYMNWEATLLSKDSEHDLSSMQRDYYAVWKDYQDNLVKFKSLLRNNRDQKQTPHNVGNANNTGKLMLPTFSQATVLTLSHSLINFKHKSAIEMILNLLPNYST